MDGRTHLVAGVATGLGAVYLKNKFNLNINELDSALFVVGCGFGSLLPDIDIDNSLLGRFIPGWLLWEHRTFTHSLLFMLVVGVIGVLLGGPYSLIIGLWIGIMTHLILDAITPMGLPYLFFPFAYDRSKKRSYRR